MVAVASRTGLRRPRRRLRAVVAAIAAGRTLPRITGVRRRGSFDAALGRAQTRLPVDTAHPEASLCRREARVGLAAISDTGEQSQGIVGSIGDLPRTEALGIELRASAATAAPSRMIEGGAFSEEPLLKRYEFGDDVKENRAMVCKTVRDFVQHFNWKGVVGISVTIEISKQLGIFGEDFVKLEKETGSMFSKTLRGKASFVHTVIHTDAAAYDELTWGTSASEEMWHGKLVLVCTLGKHIGAVLFTNGKRVRNSPLNAIFTSQWQPSISGWMVGNKFTPPQPGTPDFEKWARLVDGHISNIAAASSMVDRIIIIPTGRSAGISGLPEALQPFLDSARKAVATPSNVHVVEPREGAVVRGVALCSLVELTTQQVLRSLNSVLSGDQALHSLSASQLQMVFARLDIDCTESLEAHELQEALAYLGIERDKDELMKELDAARDGSVSFPEFMAWWSKEVTQADVVLLTSADAWRRILSKSPPEGFGDIILLEVTFTFCRACRGFASKFKRYAAKYKEVRFVQLMGNSTIGAMELVTSELGVKVSPAFFLYRRGGELISSWTGTKTEKFESELDAVLQAADA